jgi:hypothetical protein
MNCNIKSLLVPWRWPGKTAGGIVFALIFFATFLYQDKKVEYNFLKNTC